MKILCAAMLLLMSGCLLTRQTPGDHITIHPLRSGTNTLYAINGRPLERVDAISKIKRVADFTADCRVIVATGGSISVRELHSFVMEVRKCGFQEVYSLLIHDDQSFSIIGFTPADDPNLWVPILPCAETSDTEGESQQQPAP